MGNEINMSPLVIPKSVEEIGLGNRVMRPAQEHKDAADRLRDT